MCTHDNQRILTKETDLRYIAAVLADENESEGTKQCTQIEEQEILEDDIAKIHTAVDL